MDKTKETQTISKEEALKKVAEVLEEALAEYESLEKMDLELAEDPSRPMMSDKSPEEGEEEESEEEKKKKAMLAGESEEDEEDEDEDGDEDEMSDDAMKSEYAALEAKMQKRGLIKTEAKVEDVKKSEAAAPKAEVPAKDEKLESLQKSIDDRFDSFAKAINSIQETVQKIAGQPASPRKGLSGYQPLKKTEESTSSQALSKSQIVDKLVDLRKSDRRVNTALINRVETNRLTKADLDFINSILA